METSRLAERRLAALFDRTWTLGRIAAERALDRGATKAGIRKAIENELRAPSIAAQIHAVARTVTISTKTQLLRLCGKPPAMDESAVTEATAAWKRSTMGILRAMLVGGARSDDLREDAILSMLELAARARARAVSAKEAAQEFTTRAARAVRGVRARARAEVLQLGASANQAVQTSLGVKGYIWRTQGDDRVRDSHRARNGRRFNWARPPAGGHPGQDYNCRCIAIPATY